MIFLIPNFHHFFILTFSSFLIESHEMLFVPTTDLLIVWKTSLGIVQITAFKLDLFEWMCVCVKVNIYEIDGLEDAHYTTIAIKIPRFSHKGFSLFQCLSIIVIKGGFKRKYVSMTEQRYIWNITKYDILYFIDLLRCDIYGIFITFE